MLLENVTKRSPPQTVLFYERLNVAFALVILFEDLNNTISHKRNYIACCAVRKLLRLSQHRAYVRAINNGVSHMIIASIITLIFGFALAVVIGRAIKWSAQ